MDKRRENEYKNEKRERKVFTPIFVCSCVKMTGAAFFFFIQPFEMYSRNEKNSAYHCTIWVCSCVIQSRLKCNLCASFLVGLFQMFRYTHTHWVLKNLKLVKPSWEYTIVKHTDTHTYHTLCLFVFGCCCTFFLVQREFVPFYAWHHCQQYKPYTISLPHLVSLSSILKNCETEWQIEIDVDCCHGFHARQEFGCGWASFNPVVHFRSWSLPHHI